MANSATANACLLAVSLFGACADADTDEEVRANPASISAGPEKNSTLNTDSSQLPPEVKKAIQQAFRENFEKFRDCVSLARSPQALIAASVSESKSSLQYTLHFDVVASGTEAKLLNIRGEWPDVISTNARACIEAAAPKTVQLASAVLFRGETTFPMCLGFRELLVLKEGRQGNR